MISTNPWKNKVKDELVMLTYTDCKKKKKKKKAAKQWPYKPSYKLFIPIEIYWIQFECITSLNI